MNTLVSDLVQPTTEVAAALDSVSPAAEAKAMVIEQALEALPPLLGDRGRQLRHPASWRPRLLSRRQSRVEGR